MLTGLFNPEAVAVVGASRNPQKVGHSILKNIIQHGYGGRIYPINPSADSIEGLRCFRSITDVKDRVDLAVIAIPAPYVPGVLKECIRTDVSSAIVVSAGFKEAGSKGAVLEEELKEIVRGSDLRVLGPNCLGIINTQLSLNATFARGMLPRGRISFFSQSGALGVAVLDWAIGNKIGFSKFISLGNKADLNETDFTEYFLNDPDTDVILGYIEDVVEGERFIRVARKATKKKPIILIKSGGTQAGARAASSHTGALAGSETAFRAAFKQTGIIRASGINELFEIAKIFIPGRLPRGDRILIITNAGGPGIITTDNAERAGLKLPYLNKSAIKRLQKGLPPNASLYNPIDVIGDASSERYRVVLDEAVKSRDIDGIIVILTPQATTEVDKTAEVTVEAYGRTKKPLITIFMGAASVKGGIEILKSAGVSNYPYPEDAINAYKNLYRFSNWRKRKEQHVAVFDLDREGIRSVLEGAVKGGRLSLGEDEAREVLSRAGFPFPERAFARDGLEASKKAGAIGFPVVMKISSPDILHKTDVGGVKLGINSPDEAEQAFLDITSTVRRRMPGALIQGVNIYEMTEGGREVIIGVTHDSTFGHMLMFGLGGIYVEILKDVSFRVVPVTETDVREMIHEIRTYSLLKGARGERPVDIEAIVDALLRLNWLVMKFPEINELDINPLVVMTEGAVALDARIIIQHPEDKD